MRTQLFVVKKEDDIFYLAVTFTFPIKILFFSICPVPQFSCFFQNSKFQTTNRRQSAGWAQVLLSNYGSFRYVVWKHAGSLEDRTIM